MTNEQKIQALGKVTIYTEPTNNETDAYDEVFDNGKKGKVYVYAGSDGIDFGGSIGQYENGQFIVVAFTESDVFDNLEDAQVWLYDNFSSQA